ncbi:MAG: hypothetical protein ACXWUL_11320 [Caldimonas sp.]
MNAETQAPTGVERAMEALLALVESDRAQQCDAILGEANERAQSLRAQAHANARARMRQVFADERARRRERLDAAEARLATRRRLHEQQRLAGWLQLASDQLPGELQALWNDARSRASWAGAVLGAAKSRLPPGAWHVAHPADWPDDERAFALRDAAPELAPSCAADPGIAAGLEVRCGAVVLDGTIEGLLADTSAFEARLLRRLEAMP